MLNKIVRQKLPTFILWKGFTLYYMYYSFLSSSCTSNKNVALNNSQNLTLKS